VRVTASVVTFRSDPILLKKLLESLRRAAHVAGNQRPMELWIHVVVNEPDQGVENQVQGLVCDALGAASEHIGVAMIAGHGNVGYGAAQNLSLSRSDGKYHLLLNPDLVIDDGALAACIQHMEDHPNTVLIAPQGFDALGRYARLAKRRPTPWVLALRALGIPPSGGFLGRRIAAYTYADCLPGDEAVEIELASGCFMFCRTAALKSIGGFDERYFLYFEDYDLSLRLARHGLLQELPTVRVVHHGGRTARRGLYRIYHFLRSAFIFFRSVDR
jgi:GT2 family glycosyltransferase